MFELKDIERAREILEYLTLPGEFGVDADDDFYVEDIEEQIDGVINGHFVVTNGITKMVIIPDELPFVIKIPFNGRHIYDYYDEDECEVEFIYFTMAESEVSDEDYCARELELTTRIKEEGFGEFVPDMMYIGRCCGHNVYIQERVKPMSECAKALHPTEDSLNKSKKISAPFIDVWAALAIDAYGEDEYYAFLDWARSYEPEVLSDMHNGNYGVDKNGNPIILDICGFRD